MKVNQKGFSAVEGILIFILVLLISGVGYFVYNNRGSDVTENNSTAASTSAEETAPPTKLPFEYTAPAEWKTEIYKDKTQFQVNLTSPDYIKPAEMDQPSVQGANIGLSCSYTSAYTNLEQFKAKESNFVSSSSSKKDVSVSGTEAVQYVVSSTGPQLRLTTFYIDKEYCNITIEEDAYNNTKFTDTYNQLVGSVRF